MTSFRPLASWRVLITILTLLLVAASCGDSSGDSGGDAAPPSDEQDTSEAENTESETTDSESADRGVLRVGAIPDQEPERLQRTYELLSDYLEGEIPGLEVEYVPVSEYTGAVTGFSVGDLDAVWFGGLTGVQARLEVEGASAILQRDIDEEFTSVFIARVDSGIEPISDIDGLSVLAGRSFTFGSESSTSGRLMPQSFLTQSGLDPGEDFAGQPGFSGSHDATIEVVEAGSFEVGALNSQVWDARVAEGVVDTSEVIEIFRTPTYFDYHWVAQPNLDDRFGEGFTEEFAQALMALDASDPEHAAILELFGAGSFIETENQNYEAIESVGRETGLIR